MRSGRMFWVGLAVLSVSGLLLMGDLFLLRWEALSRGESDIAARGGLLLALYLPYFAAALAAIVALIAVVRARRLQQSAVRDALLAIGLVLLLVVALYVDPFSLALRAVAAARGPLGRSAGYSGFVAADLVGVAIGLIAVSRAFWKERPAPA